MSNRFRKLRMEQMEARQMMAGDVIAQYDQLTGSLSITEETTRSAGQDHGITITSLSNGNIRLTGHDPANRGDASDIILRIKALDGTYLTSNPADFVDTPGSGNLSINLGGGNDQVYFNLSSGGVPTFQNVQIDTGGAGNDNDSVFVNSLKTLGHLDIQTGAGDDNVLLGGNAAGQTIIDELGTGGVGGAPRSLTIGTGAGADTVTITNGTHVRGFAFIKTYLVNEVDNDVVYFDRNPTFDAGATVQLGHGDDRFLVTKDDGSPITWGGLTADKLLVHMGFGDDTVFARGLMINRNLVILAGAGQDNITLDNRLIHTPNGNSFIPEIGGSIDITTYDSPDSRVEKDADQVRIYGANVRGSLLARLGGGDDYFLLDEAGFIGNDLDLDAGADTDTAAISGFVVDQLLARMGEGDDTLTLKSIRTNHLIADGGGGIDSLEGSTSVRASLFERPGWEFINGRRQTPLRSNVFLLR